MNESILFGMMVFLALVELGLIYAIHKLTKQMMNWSSLFKQAEEKIQNISSGIGDIRQVIKGIDIFKKGKTPLGEIDVDIKLGDKKK